MGCIFNRYFFLKEKRGFCLGCELSGMMARDFYTSWKLCGQDLIVCVLRWAVIDYFGGKITISSTYPTTFELNLSIPEVDDFLEQVRLEY
ncbi:uncharacterized protein LOC112082444 [Eutrema salsugineum]|uniref:uncharacterized protein LOC112082444 n=1 Tax=Eutrema salsugineum TaxID=72664 RepID=UPI000CED735E|nr:uncharacterized protein LOC112082444 [Eutrema salsugineum]